MRVSHHSRRRTKTQDLNKTQNTKFRTQDQKLTQQARKHAAKLAKEAMRKLIADESLAAKIGNEAAGEIKAYDPDGKAVELLASDIMGVGKKGWADPVKEYARTWVCLADDRLSTLPKTGGLAERCAVWNSGHALRKAWRVYIGDGIPELTPGGVLDELFSGRPKRKSLDERWNEMKVALEDADRVVSHMKERHEYATLQGRADFWKGWDYLFGLGLLFPFMLGIAIRIGRFAKRIHGGRMDEKEKRKHEIEKEYREKLKSFFVRTRTVKSIEDCKKIGDDFREAQDKVEKEYPELLWKLREEGIRLIELLDDEVERLGGSKAPGR